jgi:LPXTG-motif cell wall-anchored protein
MTNKLKYSALMLALAAGTSTIALANPFESEHRRAPHQPAPQRAPEIDSSMMLSGLTLLGGTLTVLRARRKK